MNQVLVVEDEAIIRSSLRRLLERHDYAVSEAASVKESLEKYDIDSFDVIISDLRLPGPPGTDLIKATTAPVLIMTSYYSIRSAIDSIQLGAADYIAKPFEHSQMLETVSRILRQRGKPTQGHKGDAKAESGTDGTRPPAGMLGDSPPMLELFRRIHKVAPTNSTVLISGESGTGKQLVARAIHGLSGRREKEMVSVNCAAIAAELIESELFGHEKGAFAGATEARTGLVEMADGSTLFLDEIGELPLEAQARLLRVLQEDEIRKVGSVRSQKVDVRLVAATQQDLKKQVTQGAFREDLYYRINVMALPIPPLRERGSDIEGLAEALLQRTCERLKTTPRRFSRQAKRAIAAHAWPGNVRELRNAVEQAVVLAEGKEVGPELLGIETRQAASRHRGQATADTADNTDTVEANNSEANAGGFEEELSLQDYFQRFVREHEDSMNETQLAKALGISRKCLWERRQRFGMPRKKKQGRG